MAKQFMLTEERLQEIKDELEYLKTVREKEVAEQIKGPLAGDLSENSGIRRSEKTNRASCIPALQSWKTCWPTP